jgi:hypothetical protein
MTVVARTLVSVPERSAADTWALIAEIIAPDHGSAARRELAAVAGIACSCISDEALADDPLVVHGVGPRLRIYALYGDDAVDGEGANESALSWIPTDGDWRMSIPCLPDDLEWVQRKLGKSSHRVTARALGAAAEGGEDQNGGPDAVRSESAPDVDLDAFFRR